MSTSSGYRRTATIGSWTRRAAYLIAIASLGPLVVLPLSWQEQATFGAAFIGAAVLLNVTSRARTVTCALIVVSIFSTIRYGYFRVTQTWDGLTSAGHLYQPDTAFVLVLLGAEFYAFATLFLGYFQTLRPLRRPLVRLPSDTAHWPTVDVFIPTYNEPLSVVRATLMGALALDYPREKLTIYLLDDGRRPEFRACAEALGAEYITRANNAHAKAGNINHALGRTRGELVAIFDCDHVPTRAFLRATVGWFLRDERLGLVQTPHHFYSPDPFERNLGLFRKVPNEGELFHRLIQDGNDLWDASFFCGSCAVLRRSALDEIGGLAVETVTEDAHTALRMQRHGWQTAFINLPLAAGLATETLAAHIGQRIRWARGMIQILRLENPLFARGLSVAQRLCYFNASSHFLFATPRLLFLTMPLVYLLCGMVNIYGHSLAVLAYALPHLALSNLTNSRIQGRYRFSFWNEVYETALAPYILLPTLLALINPRLGKFNVTSKGGTIPHSHFDVRIALPLLGLLALNVAGLIMAHQRFVLDPAHRDTLVMNTLWTIYNVVILSVAASVAFERRQRREEVRVDVRVPLTLATPDGAYVPGMSADLSRGGAAAVFPRPVWMQRGTAVTVWLGGEGSVECQLAARVVHASERQLHLAFDPLALGNERRLLALLYSRPDAWERWHDARPLDRPLVSLLHMLWLAVRGITIVVVGCCHFPFYRVATALSMSRERERRPARRAAAAFLCTLLAPAPANGSQAAAGVAEKTTATSFAEHHELSTLGIQDAIALDRAGASQNVSFTVPITKVISEATLHLHYAAPRLQPDEAQLDFFLNGTWIAAIPVAPAEDGQASITLPADLLTTDNTVSLRLRGRCVACQDSGTPWLAIHRDSTLAFSGSRLPVPNDLSLLPAPFFDPTSQRAWRLAMVFGEAPDHAAMEAAAVVASWFGVLSDVRDVRYSVSLGQIPQGNAVVLVRRGSTLANGLGLPHGRGALLAMRNNPADPYGKLLVVAGDRSEDLRAAARAMVTQYFPGGSDAITVGEDELLYRAEYDAPRWLQTGEPAAIGLYTTDDRLRVTGSGSVNIYFRLAPDLFLQAKRSVPLLLKFTYGGVSERDAAVLHVRLNGQDIDTVRLSAASSAVTREETIHLPTGALRTYTNTMTIDADFGRHDSEDAESLFTAIHRDSSIDFSEIPHSVILPRLEVFADAGYPFTRWADLGRTAIVLPDTPTILDYETLLNMAGFFGAQTGAPVTAILTVSAAEVGEAPARDRDLLVLGTPVSQPLLQTWARYMPVSFSDGMRLTGAPPPPRLLHPHWPFRTGDRTRLQEALRTATPCDLLVQQFVSPLRADRSVVALVPCESANEGIVASLFMPSIRQGPVYGGVSIAAQGMFDSFLVGASAYRTGAQTHWQRATISLFEYYWFIPPLILAVALVLGGRLRAATDHVAARRLAARSM